MAIKVIDQRTQQEVEVSSSEAQRGILQGDYAVPAGTLTVAKGEQVGDVDAADLVTAIGQGARIVDPDEARQIDLHREETDIGSTALAAAEAAGRGVTLGGIDWLGAALGAEPERQRVRREGLGAAATGLELAGALAPSLLVPGAGIGLGAARASAAARVATLAPAGAVARGGALVERGLGAALEGLGVAPGLARTAVPLAGRGAVEAFAFNAGSNVSEAALGDRELTTDDLLADGGMAILLGAGAGALFPLAGAGLGAATSPMVRAGREVLGRAGGAVDGLATPQMTAGLLRRGGVGDDVAERLGASIETREGAEFAHRVLTEERRVLEEIASDAMVPIERARAGLAKAREIASPTRKARDIGPMLPTGEEAVQQMRQRLIGTLEETEAMVADRLAGHAADLQGVGGSMLGSRAPTVQRAGAILQQARDRMRAGLPAQGREGGRFARRDIRQHAVAQYEALDLARQDLYTLRRGLADEYARTRSPEALEAMKTVEAIHERVRTTLVDESTFGRAARAQAEESAAARAGIEARDALSGSTGKILNTRETLDVADVLNVVRNSSTFRGQTKTELFEDALQKEIAWMQALRRNREMTPDEGAVMDEAIDAARGWQKIVERQAKRVQLLDDIGVAKSVQREALADSGGVLGVDVGAGIGAGLAAATDVLAPGLGAALGGVYALGRRAFRQVRSKPYDNYRRIVALKAKAQVGEAKRVAAVGAFVRKLAEGTGKSAISIARGARRAVPIVIGDGKDRGARLDTIRKRVAYLASNPAKLAEQIRKSTLGIDEFAPEIARAIGERATVATQFLASKIPQGYVPPWSNKEPIYDPIELARFERYAEGTLKPLESLAKLETGMYSKEHAEALETVYPPIYDAVREQVMIEANKALADGRRLPQAAATQLSMLFGVPVDPTLPLARSIAATFAVAPPDIETPRPMPGGKPNQIDIDVNRYQTDAQALAGRESQA